MRTAAEEYDLVSLWEELVKLSPNTAFRLSPEAQAALIASIRESLGPIRQIEDEYICKCGIRVVPHRCSTDEEF